MELNPGPADAIGTIGTKRGAKYDKEERCHLCNMPSESLTLRSRAVEFAVITCPVEECQAFVHDHCLTDEMNSQGVEWICTSHSDIHNGRQSEPNQPRHHHRGSSYHSTTADISIPAEVSAITDTMAPADVPAAVIVPAPADLLVTVDVPVPVDAPATSDVPALADVPASVGVPAPADVPATVGVPAPADVPAAVGVPAPADVPAAVGVPAPADLPAAVGVPAPADLPDAAINTSSEPIPGPSFLSVTLMDVMEALRMTHLKMDKLSNDLQEMRQEFQTVLHRSEQTPAPIAGHADSTPQHRQTGPTLQRRGGKTASSQRSGPEVLIVGDSNVRRLETSNGVNGRLNISFRSVSGATTQHVESELRTSKEVIAPKVIFHVGTNDLTSKGSEQIASDLFKLAKETGGRSGVDEVYICSVIPRKDLGSLVFSRSESVNNRLHSLCMKTTGITFIDLRQDLDRCPFTGLVRDALHYNRAGASHALDKIMDSVGNFLA